MNRSRWVQRRWRGIVLAIVTAAGLLAGCGQAKTDPLEAIRQRGILMVAVANDEPEKISAVTELEHQAAEALAEELAVAVQFVPVKAEGLEAAVSAGQADLAAGLLIPWDSRQGDFSLTYGGRGVYLAVIKERQTTALNELTGSTLGISGRLGRSTRQQLGPLGEFTFKEYNNPHDIRQDLQNGVVTGYLCYEDEAVVLLEETDIVVRDCPEIRKDSYAFTAGSRQTELIVKINQILTEILMKEK